ncbi:MAG: hypothetical protein ACI8PZ_002415 [Myxococcota bacterium]|jgi:hypothetical protein
MKNRPPDFEAEVTLLPTRAGGRSKPAFSGYRPHLAVLPEVLTSGQQAYVGVQEVPPGGSALARITLLSPESCPRSLWVGKRLRMHEGGRLVGHAVVRRVLNPMLDASTSTGPAMSMALPFDDAAWALMEGGYRVPFDPRPDLERLESGDHAAKEKAWGSLWENLHHQGDIGVASYAALAHLVRIRAESGCPDWRAFGLAALIEECRLAGHNPEIPARLANGYRRAWECLLGLALEDIRRDEEPDLIRAALSIVAFARGLTLQGRVLAGLTDDELAEALGEPGPAGR